MQEQSPSERGRNNRRGIQSVEIGLRVLAALAANSGPSSLTAVGARCGLSPSQTHRYLQSLVATGMAVQDATSRYDLGPGVIRIGVAAIARLDPHGRIESILRDVVEETGRTIAVSVWGQSGPVCVRWLPGNPPLLSSLGVGVAPPLLHSAAGQVFLSFLSDAELAVPLAAARAAVDDPPNVETIRGAVRGRLIAYCEDDSSPGLRAAAAPVFDLQGRVIVVASVLGSRMFSPSKDAATAARLLQACRSATELIGGVWPALPG